MTGVAKITLLTVVAKKITILSSVGKITWSLNVARITLIIKKKYIQHARQSSHIRFVRSRCYVHDRDYLHGRTYWVHNRELQSAEKSHSAEVLHGKEFKFKKGRPKRDLSCRCVTSGIMIINQARRPAYNG